MSRYEVGKALPLHADYIAADARQVDVEEWVLGGGKPFALSLRQAIAGCASATILVGEGRALCLWGVNPGPAPDVGLAWLVATNRGAAEAWSIQRLFRRGISDMHAAYPTLHAWAYSENTLHHRWMERLGFVRTGEERLMGMGARFLLFVRHKEP